MIKPAQRLMLPASLPPCTSPHLILLLHSTVVWHPGLTVVMTDQMTSLTLVGWECGGSSSLSELSLSLSLSLSITFPTFISLLQSLSPSLPPLLTCGLLDEVVAETTLVDTLGGVELGGGEVVRVGVALLHLNSKLALSRKGAAM